MSAPNNFWPVIGSSGYPLNPERSGWHVLEWLDGNGFSPLFWQPHLVGWLTNPAKLAQGVLPPYAAAGRFAYGYPLPSPAEWRALGAGISRIASREPTVEAMTDLRVLYLRGWHGVGG